MRLFELKQIHYDNWRMPDQEELRNELSLKKAKNYSKELGLGNEINCWDSWDNIQKAVKNGKVVRLSYEDYDNIERLSPANTLKGMRDISLNYRSGPRDPFRIATGFENNDAIPMAIIIDCGNSRLVLTAGNTRLGCAKICNITPYPKVLIISGNVNDNITENIDNAAIDNIDDDRDEEYQDNIPISKIHYHKKTDFVFKNGAMLMQRVGPINAQKQSHDTGYTAPIRRGMWAFPFPAMDLFFVSHRYEPLIPVKYRLQSINKLQDENIKANKPVNDGIPEELWIGREEYISKVKNKMRPKTFWWKGPIYSRIAPKGFGGSDWYLWTDLKAWAKLANASMVVGKVDNEKRTMTYSVDHLELFLPLKGGIIS